MELETKCYHCDSLATSREHVPPLCIFPEAKDVRNMNFRKNLITVPSCDLHNSNKSHDDEFLMVSVAGIVSNNKLGFVHNRTKIDRALRRKSKDFINKCIIKNNVEKTIIASTGTKFPVLLGNPDVERLKNCFEHIAYGIWQHEFGNSFKGTVKIVLGFLIPQDNDGKTLDMFIKRKFQLEPGLLEIKGSNPEVFTYQFCKPDNFGASALKLVFYQGTEVFVAMLPEGKPIPYDLGFDLMQKGIHSNFKLGNENFEFNKPNDLG